MGSALDYLMREKYESVRDQERLNLIRNAMNSFKVSAEVAMESLGIPKSEFKKYLMML